MDRVNLYRKDTAEESFMELLNTRLRSFEMMFEHDYNLEHDFVFVVGAPRSGTTLLTQVLAFTRKMSYITNVAARFWKAPVVGIRLSDTLLGETPAQHLGYQFFQSDYARTVRLGGIHEFGYFWRHWLRMQDAFDLRKHDIDEIGLRRTLSSIQHEFNSDVVMKNIYGAYRAREITELLDGHVRWIHIERDVADTCVSILNARKAYYGNEDSWFGYVPFEYDRIKHLEPRKQIVAQVMYLRRYYRKVADDTVTFEDLLDTALPAGAIEPRTLDVSPERAEFAALIEEFNYE